MTTPADDFDAKNCPHGPLKVTMRTVRQSSLNCKVPYSSTPPNFEIEVLNRTGYDVELKGRANVIQGSQWIGIAATPGDPSPGHASQRNLFGSGCIVPDQQGRKLAQVVMNSNVAAIQRPSVVEKCKVIAKLNVAIGYFNYSEAGDALLELDAEP